MCLSVVEAERSTGVDQPERAENGLE